MDEKIKKKDLVFNEEGELKGSLDTLERSDTSPFNMVKLNFKDEEGKKLVFDELEKIIERQGEYLASLTFPEKMKAYGHTFESLADAYKISTNQVCEFARRLRLIEVWSDKGVDPPYCTCSAMVWDQEFEGNIVPYLYCVIVGGMDRIRGTRDFGEECATCENTPCEHFWEPEHDSMNCRDYVRRKSKKYPVTACVYANPSDSDIDIALELHQLSKEDE